MYVVLLLQVSMFVAISWLQYDYVFLPFTIETENDSIYINSVDY
jgi:hypothetical protein